MSDSDLMLAVLTDARGGWVSHSVILGRAQYQTGHGLTPHSRAADLRKRGLNVECRVETDSNGRRQSFYRLAETERGEQAAAKGRISLGADPAVEAARLATPRSVSAKQLALLPEPALVREYQSEAA